VTWEVLGGFGIEGCSDFFTAVVGSVGWWNWIPPGGNGVVVVVVVALRLRMKHGLNHSRILFLYSG